LKFLATIIPSGNATAVEVPQAVADGLGPQARTPITITIHGHTWRSRVALMHGRRLVGISAANRAAAGAAEGDIVEVDIAFDDLPREVAEPPDLTAALNNDLRTRAAFDRMPFGLKRKHVAAIDQAKAAEVRQRRIEKLVASLSASS
jgi:hypothetical protein